MVEIEILGRKYTEVIGNEDKLEDRYPKPPVPDPIPVGYKGKGMCGACYFQQTKIPNTTRWLCSYYGGSCKSVSRNCSGVRALKK